jgi:DNA-binding PadR family transcriptional regulator
MSITVNSRRASGFSPEFALMGFLDQSPTHGYELHQKLDEHLGEIWHTNLSQTYNILNRLEAQGFIQGTTLEQENRPAKRWFHLTAAGKERFEAWLSSLSACSVHAVRVDFLTKLFFLHGRNPAGAVKLIEAQAQALQDQVARLRSRLGQADSLLEAPAFNRMGLIMRIRQLELLIESLNDCKRHICRALIPPES